MLKKGIRIRIVNKIVLLCIISLLANVSIAAASTKTDNIPVTVLPVHYQFNGVEYAPSKEQHSFLYNNSVYVPLRFVANSLNKTVRWDAATKTVTVREPNASEQLLIEEYKLNAAVRNTGQVAKTDVKDAVKKLTVNVAQITYIFDGKTVKPKAELPGLITKGTVYVPVRFFSEALGNEVKWEKKTNTVFANTPEHSKNQDQKDESTKPADKSNQLSTGTTKEEQKGNNGGQSGNVTAPNNPSTPSNPSNPSDLITPTKTYDSIVNDAEKKLYSLQSKAESSLLEIAKKYINEKDSTEKERLKNEGINEFDSFKNQFESIINETQQQLSSNGYNTNIINSYQKEFDRQVELGKKILDGML